MKQLFLSTFLYVNIFQFVSRKNFNTVSVEEPTKESPMKKSHERFKVKDVNCKMNQKYIDDNKNCIKKN